MSGKKRHYKKSINNLLPETKVQSFVVDFEKSLWQEIRESFEAPQINSCASHCRQALWRKAQEFGLQQVYQEHDSMYKLLRQVFTLPLLPAEDIPPPFA
ncbi:hypothetical protein ACJMK2_007065 [Sinanodonta woodiana]|uniref:Transposase n=1 Tax=Sinanodonta woodiana TaxID=1069815 RepID=A0ABD3VIG6_SINWO